MMIEEDDPEAKAQHAEGRDGEAHGETGAERHVERRARCRGRRLRGTRVGAGGDVHADVAGRCRQQTTGDERAAGQHALDEAASGEDEYREHADREDDENSPLAPSGTPLRLPGWPVEISCIFSLPGSCLRTHVPRYAATARPTTARPELARQSIQP